MEKIFSILFLSNMMEEKGVWTLIEACRILKEHSFKFECHFVGKWSDITEEIFNKRIAENELKGKVFAHGAKYGEKKSIFWKNADVFVFPTYYHNECFPLVLLEAMQHGKACIASNEGGIPAIIEEGKTGYMVKKKDAKLLADKIEFLLKNPSLCQQMGKNGKKKFLKEFTIERFENNMKNILGKLITN